MVLTVTIVCGSFREETRTKKGATIHGLCFLDENYYDSKKRGADSEATTDGHSGVKLRPNDAENTD